MLGGVNFSRSKNSRNCVVCVFLGTHAMSHFVNWEISQECGLGSQNSEPSKRTVSLVVKMEMLIQILKNGKRTNYFNDLYLYSSYSFDLNDKAV